MKLSIILLPFVLLFLVSADVLQNPDFELPPSKFAPNSTEQQVPLNENNTIPGWTVQGTVELYYLTSSILGNQHQAILLAEDAKINQTFIANGNLNNYLLTFTLALRPSSELLKCSANISLVISAPDRDSEFVMKPEGKAAIELTSGGGEIAGVNTAVTITEGTSYELGFMLGDANDSCNGDLVVGVQAGQTTRNITLQSSGTGSANHYSVTFKAGQPPNSISFQSYIVKQTADGIICGPVVDAVVLRASDGHMNKCTFVALLLLILHQRLFNLFST